MHPKRKEYLHLAVAGMTCPCHVPIYLAIFGGTALGAYLRDSPLLFVLGLTGIFLLILSKGLRLSILTSERAAKVVSSYWSVLQ